MQQWSMTSSEIFFGGGAGEQMISINYGKFTKKFNQNHKNLNISKNKLHFCLAHLNNELKNNNIYLSIIFLIKFFFGKFVFSQILVGFGVGSVIHWNRFKDPDPYQTETDPIITD